MFQITVSPHTTPTKGHSPNNNRKVKSFDKRHIKSKKGFEMVIKAEKVTKDVFSVSNLACGVIGSNLNNVEPGDMIPHKNHQNNTFIFNLVIKKNKEDQPSYENLRKSLVLMLQHMKENDVRKVVFPLNPDSCIIQELSWNAVRTLIKNVFYEESIHIVAYNTSLRHLPSNENVISNARGTPFLDIFEGKNLTSILPVGKGSSEYSKKLKKFPEIFKNDKLYFQPGVKDKQKLLQYVYTFGGEVVDSVKGATVIIFDDGRSVRNGVHVQWLIDSIKLQKRMDTKLYYT